MASKAKIYLYKEGNECESLTGGFSDLLLRNQGGTITRTKEADCLKVLTNITVPYPTNGGYVSKNLIDMSKFSTIYYNYSFAKSGDSSSNYAMAIYSDVSTSNAEILTRYTAYSTCLSGENLISNIDVSALQNVYIGFNAGFNQNTSETKVYNIYLTTKENIITVHSQSENQINFSASNLDNLIYVQKVEVLINSKASKTYTDDFYNISYDIDSSLCSIGYNKIVIRVTYTQGDGITETVSEILTYNYTIDQLPTTTSLKQVVETVELIAYTNKIEYDTLKTNLENKGVEVLEEDKMSNLIDKVNLLKNAIPNTLYLYDAGDECTALTGGWQLYKTHTSSYGNVTLTKNADNFYLEAPSGNTSGSTSHGNVCTLKEIDVSKYSKLKFDVEVRINGTQAYARAAFEVTDSSNNIIIGNSYKSYTSSRNIETLDISSISKIPKARVYINADPTSTNPRHFVKIYKIWLER